MSRKMYIYRADFNTKNGQNTRFFYARNARIGKDFCAASFREEGDIRPQNITLNKIGRMTLDVGSNDAALMDQQEETRLILQNYGAGVKYAERDDIDGLYEPVGEHTAEASDEEPAMESEAIGGDTERV